MSVPGHALRCGPETSVTSPLRWRWVQVEEVREDIYPVVEAVGMWESRRDFQRVWEGVGSRLHGFPCPWPVLPGDPDNQLRHLAQYTAPATTAYRDRLSMSASAILHFLTSEPAEDPGCGAAPFRVGRASMRSRRLSPLGHCDQPGTSLACAFASPLEPVSARIKLTRHRL